ncbi:MAG TPA: CbiX/SirB N-terminal domain-containing protein [Paucimonas sp.]|nr:CbiX/SirB N-terminal domain-containing protein [Paucimonas sp.]
MTRRLLVLFAHGARDPRWAAPFERLRTIVQELTPDSTVALAYLELMAPNLPDLVRQAAKGGCKEVTVVPVFFGQGGHVLRDLPPMIAGLRNEFPEMRLKTADAVGENADVLNAIARYCVAAQGGD